MKLRKNVTTGVWYRRLLLLSLAVLLLAGLGYGSHRLGFSGSFLYVYLFGMILTEINFLLTISIHKNEFALRFLFEWLKQRNEQSLWNRLRVWTTVIISMLSSDLCWPVSKVRVYRKLMSPVAAPNFIEIVRTSETQSTTTFAFAVYRLSFAAILFLLLRPKSAYGFAFLTIVLASIFLQHLAYLISGYSTVRMLRQTIGSPTLKLLLLTILDLGALSLAISALFRVHPQWGHSVGGLKDIALQLLSSPKRFAALFANGTTGTKSRLLKLSGVERVTLFFGLPMYGALLQTLVTSGFNSLKRTDADFLAISRSLALDGQYREAHKWLSMIEAETIAVREARSDTFLFAGDIAQAKHVAKLALDADHEIVEAPTDIDIYMSFFIKWLVLPNAAKACLKDSVIAANLPDSAKFVINIFVIYSEQHDIVKPEQSALLLDTIYNVPFRFTQTDHPEITLAYLRELTPVTPLDKLVWGMIIYISFAKWAGKAPENKARFDLWLSGTQGSINSWSETCRILSKGRSWSQTITLALNEMIIEPMRPINPDFARAAEQIRDQVKLEIGKRNGGEAILANMESEIRKLTKAPKTTSKRAKAF